jgi:hypothetical protein
MAGGFFAGATSESRGEAKELRAYCGDAKQKHKSNTIFFEKGKKKKVKRRRRRRGRGITIFDRVWRMNKYCPPSLSFEASPNPNK